MNILWLLTLVSVGMAAIALVAFMWAVRNGQLDDLTGPGERLVVDDILDEGRHTQ